MKKDIVITEKMAKAMPTAMYPCAGDCENCYLPSELIYDKDTNAYYSELCLDQIVYERGFRGMSTLGELPTLHDVQEAQEIANITGEDIDMV